VNNPLWCFTEAECFSLLL